MCVSVMRQKHKHKYQRRSCSAFSVRNNLNVCVCFCVLLLVKWHGAHMHVISSCAAIWWNTQSIGVCGVKIKFGLAGCKLRHLIREIALIRIMENGNVHNVLMKKCTDYMLLEYHGALLG